MKDEVSQKTVELAGGRLDTSKDMRELKRSRFCVSEEIVR